MTQAQWEAVVGDNPSHFKGPDLPVENVSERDIREFLGRLNAREKDARYPRRGGLVERELRREDASGRQKKPNAWGLYDMRGNVEELVQERFQSYKFGRQVDPHRPSSGFDTVVRGRSWEEAESSRGACLDRSRVDTSAHRNGGRGFRTAMTLR